MSDLQKWEALVDDLQKWENIRDGFMIQSIKIKLILASGTFIVTLAFLSKDQIMFYKEALLASWACLMISIFMGMWAMTAGISRYDRAVKGRKGELEGKEKALYEKGKVLTSFEAKTPTIQTWSYALGLLSFGLFVVLNTWDLIQWCDP